MSVTKGKLTIFKNQVIGRGCLGTEVFKGVFEKRQVAVKRVLKNSVKIFEREVELLRNVDEDKNVIRFFCTEEDDDFYYIALELCICTLDDFILNQNNYTFRSEITDKEVLKQIASGLNYIHSYGIVHRDLKPQNILFTKIKDQVMVKISDFGFSKDLNYQNNSRMSIAPMGSQYWLAPEATETNKCNKPCDIFSLGCIFFFVINKGSKLSVTSRMIDGRSVSIRNYNFDFSNMSQTSDNILIEALIKQMVKPNPGERFTANQILSHPYFWDLPKILGFITDISNRLELRDGLASRIQSNLEVNSHVVTKGNWISHIDPDVASNLLGRRGYSGSSVCDLLRAIRNKKAHYEEMSATLKNIYGPLPNQFTNYWLSRFPHLIKESYEACMKSGLNNEENFKIYF